MKQIEHVGIKWAEKYCLVKKSIQIEITRIGQKAHNNIMQYKSVIDENN